MINLTHDNYYSFQNTNISNSKVGDFLKSKNYYYRKHILKEMKKPITTAMKIGMLVDDLTSQMDTQFKMKVLKREDPDEFEVQKYISPDLLLTPDQWNEAHERAAAIIKEPFYQWYDEQDTQFQYIFDTSIDGIKICGMADILVQTPTTVYIDDVKSVGYLKVASPTKWYYNCLDMGYFRQFGGYRQMWKLMHPEDVRPVICRHVIVTKVDAGVYKVSLFEIDDQLLTDGWNQFRAVANEIVDTTNWEDDPVTWENLKKIAAPGSEKSDFSDMDEF